jgi:hypothetical protein
MNGNDKLEEQYDEFGEVYACIDSGNELIRCCDCSFAECEMRGKNNHEQEE